MRIGLADKTLVVALAHAMVLKEIGDKRISSEALTQKLEEGAEIVKAVYRYGLQGSVAD